MFYIYINGEKLHIKEVNYIKDGEIILTSKYDKTPATQFLTTAICDNIYSISATLKKAKSNTIEKLIKENTSFIVSTNTKDYDGEIIYNLYLGGDVVTVEQVEDVVNEQDGGNIKNYQKQFLINVINGVFTVNPYAFINLNEKEYNDKYNYYKNNGFYDYEILRFMKTFKREVEECDYDIKNGEGNTYTRRKKEYAEKMIKRGYFANIYTRVEKEIKSFNIHTCYYKTEKTAEQVKKEKVYNTLTQILKLDYISQIAFDDFYKNYKLVKIRKEKKEGATNEEK